MPVIAARTFEPSPPVTETVYAIPDIAADKNIFTVRCSRCHGLPDPGLYTPQRWDGILAIMILRARLSKEQAIHVRAYLKAKAAN